MDVIRSELEQDAQDQARFEASGVMGKAFSCWRQFWDAKKYCCLCFILSLILTIQLIALFPPGELVKSETVKEGAEIFVEAMKSYFGVNKTVQCMVSPETNSTMGQ